MRNHHERKLRRSIAITLNKVRSLTASAAVGVTAVATLPGIAFAQDSDLALEEVVVTAQRRTERLQEVPIAVSALSGADLEKQGVERFSDLERVTPSLTVSDGPGGRFLNIRGVGIGVSTPFQTAGVPLHLDGMYVPRSEQFLRDAYFDIERVELYRGPQGTFAGQNSTGGALFVTAQQPKFNEEVEFGIEQAVGNYHRYETDAFVNLPISDKWAARIAVTDRSRDGYAENHGPGPNQIQTTTTITCATTLTGGVPNACTPANAIATTTTTAPYGVGASNNIDGNPTIGTDNRRSIRGILRYQPSESFDARLRYDYVKEETNGEANARAPFMSFNDPDRLLSPYDYYSDFRGWNDNQVHRVVLNLAWQLNDGMLLKSVSGYQRMNADAAGDSDGTSPFVVVDPTIDWNPAVPGIQTYPPQGWAMTRTRDDYYYQEFDLVSTGTGPLKWVVGVVGLTQKSLFNNNNGAYQAQTITYTEVISPTQSRTTTTIIPPTSNVLNAVPPGSWLDYHQSHESYAAFGDVTYAIGDSFEVKGGARYTYDHIELDRGSTVRSAGTGQLSDCDGGPAFYPCNVFGYAEVKKVTWSGAFNWFPGGNRDTTFYANASLGMKPGGYLTQFTLQTPEPPGSDGHPGSKPETLKNYEMGFKYSTSWLQTAASAYYQDYRNYQAQFRIPGQAIPRAQNIDKTEGKGAEFQARAALGGLGLNLNVGYHDSEIKETALRPVVPANYYSNGSPSFNLDPRGLRLNFDPEWTYNIGLDYTMTVGSEGLLTPYVQYSFVDEQWTQLTHASQDFIPSREIVDFRLVYRHGERWRVEGYVTNVLDERYVAGIAGGPTATPYYASVALGAPREYGLKVRFEY